MDTSPVLDVKQDSEKMQARTEATLLEKIEHIESDFQISGSPGNVNQSKFFESVERLEKVTDAFE